MSPAVRLNVVSTCMVRALWMRARRRGKKVKMRMPPGAVVLMEWTYRSSTGFNKSFAKRSATPETLYQKKINPKQNRQPIPGMSLPCLNCSFFTVRSISCLTRPFCSAGATSAGVLPLRISWVVRAERENKLLIKNGVGKFYVLLTIVNCPDSRPMDSCC